MKWSGNRIEIKNTLLRQSHLDSLAVTGKTLETGEGDKSPDNPYMLAGVTKLTISDGGSNLQTVALPQPLYSLPDGTADDYDAVSGQGTQRVRKVVFDGDENIAVGTIKAATQVFAIATNETFPSNEVFICSSFSSDRPAVDVEKIIPLDTHWFVAINKSRLSGWSDDWTNGQKIAAFKTWLSAHPVTVLYELASPQAITGTPQTIPTYYPYTQIVNDAGGGMTVTAKPIGEIKLLQMLPTDYHHSTEIIDIQNALDVQSEKLRGDLNDLLQQLNIETATWGLNLWEDAYGIPHEVMKPFEYRRTRIESKMRSQGITTVAMIKNVAESFSNGEVDVIEHPAEYRFDIKFVGTLGIPPNLNDLSTAIEEIKPAHLAYAYVYTYITWSDVEKYNHTWDEWDAKNLTWNDFEIYRE